MNNVTPRGIGMIRLSSSMAAQSRDYTLGGELIIYNKITNVTKTNFRRTKTPGKPN